MAALLIFFGPSAAESTARLTLSALHPLKAVQYAVASHSTSAQQFLPQESETPHGANPFEDFVAETPSPAPAPTANPDSPYPIVPITYTPITNDVTYRMEDCYVKNVTKLSKSEVAAELLQNMDFSVEKHSDQPQILIMHTHATESYQNHDGLYYDPDYTCRDTDNSRNMVRIGSIIAEELNRLGYNTLQDATLHDYPNYNGSYDRSKATVESYLAKYPSIKVVLDVHRDAIERTDGTRIKPVTTIDGKDCAQVMIISGADNGYLNMPNYKKNLRFASHLQNSMEGLYPTLTRPILFDYRNYNQQLTTGSILIEVGGHANTLEEAENAALLIARSLAYTFDKAK